MSTIGVLALQGDFARHIQVVRETGHQAIPVKTETELELTDALIIPGGESTTLLKLLHDSGMYQVLREYATDHPMMGTCAGCICLAKHSSNLSYPTLNLIDIDIERNAYGRQRESFIDQIKININAEETRFNAVFIRAPVISAVGKGVNIYAFYDNKPVMAANKRIFVSTFHPELAGDSRIHRFFIQTFL